MQRPTPAVPGPEPPITAVCVALFGMGEGSDGQVLDRELGLVMGETVSFRCFGPTVRRKNVVGTDVERWKLELDVRGRQGGAEALLAGPSHQIERS